MTEVSILKQNEVQRIRNESYPVPLLKLILKMQLSSVGLHLKESGSLFPIGLFDTKGDLLYTEDSMVKKFKIEFIDKDCLPDNFENLEEIVFSEVLKSNIDEIYYLIGNDKGDEVSIMLV